MITKYADFVFEAKRIYPNDIVNIHYWVTGDVCQVQIIEQAHGKVKVSYDVEDSPYFGAPEQWIKKADIISMVN